MEIAKSREYSIKKATILFVKTLSAGIVFALLFLADCGDLRPFSFGLYMALCLLGFNQYYLSAAFLCAGFVCGFDVGRVIVNAVIVVFTLLICFVFKKKNKKVPLYVAILVAAIANCPIFYFCGRDMFVVNLINILIGTTFMVSCIIFCSALIKRNFIIKLNIDESVCGGILLLAIFCGIANIQILQLDFIRFFGVLFLLVTSKVASTQVFSLLGVTIGIGAALCQEQIAYIALFGMLGLMCAIFKSNKIYACLSVVFTDILIGLYFNAFISFSWYNIGATVLACLVFLLIKNSVFKKLSSRLFVSSNDDATKNIISRNKITVGRKLEETADVFFELDKIFRKLIKGNLPIEDAKKMIAVEIMQHNCEGCKNKSQCFRSFGDKMKEVFDALVNAGFEKGKITLVDLPQFLTSRCVGVNNLVSTTNSLLQQYKQYSSMVDNIDASKILIAEQLDGVSKILKNLSKDVGGRLTFDDSKEERLKEEFTYNDIIVTDIVVYDEDLKTCAVTIVLRTIDAGDERILQIVNRVCNSKFVIDEILPAGTPGLTMLNLKTAPVYDIAFGLSRDTKGESNISGDTHSVLRLDNDKFLLCVCDGMGSDETAFQTSSTAIGLIENFYRAGYDSDIIMSSVNKLLNLGRNDVFSALDVCVVDLKNGMTDFVKLGASVGFVKQQEKTSIVESGSLPLGILEEVKPKITKTVISAGDMIVLVSDGIIDAFGSEEKLCNYINNVQTHNPQILSDNILMTAKDMDKGFPNDDMTVLVGKMFVA